MPDLTSSGKPVDDRSRMIAVRRLEIQRQKMVTANMEAELVIEQSRDNILRHEEQIAATLKAIADLDEQIKLKREEVNNG